MACSNRLLLTSTLEPAKIALTAIGNVLGESFEHGSETPIPAGFQQIGADGRGAHPHRYRVRKIVLGDTGREADHHIAVVSWNRKPPRERIG